MTFRADVRAACVSLLEAYRDAVKDQRESDNDPRPFRLNVYPGRPKTIAAPHAFVDGINESIVYTGPSLVQRNPIAEVVVIHGLFDSKEAVDQADEFMDGFLAYVNGQVHAAGANSTIGIRSMNDEPSFVADWITPGGSARSGESQGPYFATRISLEGFAES